MKDKRRRVQRAKKQAQQLGEVIQGKAVECSGSGSGGPLDCRGKFWGAECKFTDGKSFSLKIGTIRKTIIESVGLGLRPLWEITIDDTPLIVMRKCDFEELEALRKLHDTDD